MAKVLQETGNDIIDVLVFPDGSWKVVSVHDEKSDRHAADIIQQNGDTVETDATPSDVIDLINRDDDGDVPMSLASASEDMKPLLNSQDLSVADYLPDFPVGTAAQPEDLYVGGGSNRCSNGTSTSGQNSLLSSASGPASSSFGTLESILPQNVLRVQPVITDAVAPSLATSNSTSAMQQFSQGTYPDIMQMQPPVDPLLVSEAARPPIPRNVRREPVAVQALAVPLQNPGASRRVQPNVLNCPPPTPQSSSASSNYQAHHVTNADSIITKMMNNGVRPPSRAPDAASLLHLQLTQQDSHSTPNHLYSRFVGLSVPPYMGTRPPTGGPGQGRGANAYGAPSPQYQQFDQRLLNDLMSQHTFEVPQVSPTQPGGASIQSHLFSTQHSQALRSQAVSRPTIPQAQPHLQSPSLPSAAPTPSTPLVEASHVQELQVEPNWQPTGRMRGSLTGSAYNQAIERYLHSGGQQTSQARPPGMDPRR